MLIHLQVNNFTLVEHLELELQAGMTVITGETGAGKSVLLDALGLTLGDRADSDKVRHGCDRADITAGFDLSALPEARDWLADQELDQDGECFLRRTVSKDGRSRGYINGRPASLLQLKALGDMLIDIHGQHEHQSLLRKDTHRKLLDDYGQLGGQVNAVRNRFREWQQALERYTALRDNADEVNARVQLLQFQVQELDQLGLETDEVSALEEEQKLLANAEAILHGSGQVADLLDGEADFTLISALGRAVHLLHDLPQRSERLDEAAELLGSAQIQVQEAARAVQQHIDGFELDPERLHAVEERLSAVYQIARKHKVKPAELPGLHAELQQELEQLTTGGEQLDQLEATVADLEQRYRKAAKQLSQARAKAAERLAAAVNEQLAELAMTHARFAAELQPLPAERPAATGLEAVEFLLSTNPGQPPKPLIKIASGGELSRVSLAIQVVTAQTSVVPTLVFDEVDVGIGGATADVVGRLLRKLGDGGQVLCVTHLPQVAAKGHQHLQVEKEVSGNSTRTHLRALSAAEREEEIARMLGGMNVTEQSRAHAREMLGLASPQ